MSQYANKDGVWEWKEAPVDMFAADICRPGGMQLSHQALIARPEEYTFRVPPALVVSGKVIDAKTRQPIPRFRVVPGSPSFSNTRDGFTATGGQYRVRETYAQGVYRVRIEADGYFPADSRDIPTDSGSVTANFELKRGEDFVGTVLGPDSVPAAGAKLALGVHGAQIMVTNGHIDEHQTYSLRETADPQGRLPLHTASKGFLARRHASGGFQRAEVPSRPFADGNSLARWARVGRNVPHRTQAAGKGSALDQPVVAQRDGTRCTQHSVQLWANHRRQRSVRLRTRGAG